MNFQRRRISNRLFAGIILALSAATIVGAQEKPETASSPKEPLRQYIVIMKRGPKWIPGKSVGQQPLLNHAKYLKELMDKGSLQFAGPFLDDSGGFILLNAEDEAAARRITEHDPGVLEQILEAELHPFRMAFDAGTGKSPFK